MVTGDNINTTKAYARECGILTDDGIAIEGLDFVKRPRMICLKLFLKFRWKDLFRWIHTLVKQLRTTFEEVVAVTKDGTNDAPALHEADIGLAMGIEGTELQKVNLLMVREYIKLLVLNCYIYKFCMILKLTISHRDNLYLKYRSLTDILFFIALTAYADVIILDDNFSTFVTAAKWGCSVYVNIQKFGQFQLIVNVVALIVNFSSACLTGSAPLTVVQLLWVNMIMDTIGALVLATKPPTDELMERQPFGRKGNFITNVMWRNIMGQSLYQTMKPSKQVIGLVSRLVFYFNFWSVGFRVFQTVLNSLFYDLDQKSSYKTRLNRMI
ncbi:putative cation-transporting P-type ATPase, HAD superfamily [Helianthus anomalus]